MTKPEKDTLQIFKTKAFVKFADKEEIDDSALREAVERAENGLIDAELGGCIIKQRVGGKGKGRSGGYRVLIAARLGKRYVFMDGFAKNEKDNISKDELAVMKKYGSVWLNADDQIMRLAIKTNKLAEVKYEKKD